MKDRSGNDLTTRQIVAKSKNRITAIGSEFFIMLLSLVGYIPSHHVRRFLYRISGISIGSGSAIHMGATFYDTDIFIGSDSILGEGIVLDGRAKVIIGDHVAIASDVMIYSAEHNISDKDFSPIFEPVVIEDYVFIGPRAIILPGVTIKKGAVVGAGAVVTKNVEEMTIVGGVPARPIGKRNVSELSYRLGRAALFR